MAAKSLRNHLPDNMAKIRRTFLQGVNAVQPHKLIRNHLKQDGNKLVINNNKYNLHQNVYVVGFGKAVIGMVQPVESVLRTSDGVSHLRRGIVSVPVGIKEVFSQSPHLLPSENSSVDVLEGANYNIPDEAAFTASRRIVSLVQQLSEDDILLVLISGGGSALLPYPVAPVTLKEKSEIIKSISHAGASITELNTVRKALSGTKGGRLAELTKAKIVSFILSDIINSPLDMIASGPTVPNKDPPGAAVKVLEKYNISVPEHVKTLLQTEISNCPVAEYLHVTNVIIGSNETALSSVASSIVHESEGEVVPLMLTSSLRGEASHIGRKLADLVASITKILSHEKDDHISQSLLLDLCISVEKKSVIMEALVQSKATKCPLCLIFGGESTVTVQGPGRGGRNQEMVLSTSISLEKVIEMCV